MYPEKKVLNEPILQQKWSTWLKIEYRVACKVSTILSANQLWMDNISHYETNDRLFGLATVYQLPQNYHLTIAIIEETIFWFFTIIFKYITDTHQLYRSAIKDQLMNHCNGRVSEINELNVTSDRSGGEESVIRGDMTVVLPLTVISIQAKISTTVFYIYEFI